LLEDGGDPRAAGLAFRRAFELGARDDWLRAKVQALGG
jgi:hypothetical protein